tara:strand:- start:99 stop:974 length:876 start_codon:yes stop_codon:yes gene_type:complete
MAKFATGKHSKAVSDRSGMVFPYDEMVREWNGSLVHYSEFEPKHPQIRRKFNISDAIALQNPRNMKFQQPTQEFTNETPSSIFPGGSDVTISDSGGASVGVANLTLPGDFAFKTQDFQITRTINGVQETAVLHSMIPEDPALQNRRRSLKSNVGQVAITIPNSATLTTTVASGQLYLGGGSVGNVYYFGGVREINLGFDIGTVITFNQDDATNDGHPLIVTTNTSSPNSYIIQSDVVYYLDGTSTQSNYTNTTTFNAATNRYVQWTPSVAGTYFYACYVHGIGMGGKITIS